MILIDYSGLAHAAYYSNPNPSMEEGFMRHMILNSLRLYQLKYRGEFGRTIIAADGGSWRRSMFAEYKGARRKSRDEQDGETKAHWKEFYRISDLVLSEIEAIFPYTVIRIPNCEADDVIGVCTETTQEFGSSEPVMIISSDHDFIQLQKYSNVRQFSPTTKKEIKEKDPSRYLVEQIIRGCSSDGVPNIYSDDDVFVNEEKRQAPVTTKKLLPLLEAKDESARKFLLTAQQIRNYDRNKLLVDFSSIPEYIKTPILEKLAAGPVTKNNSLIYSYLIDKRCRMLVSSASDFFTNK